jgi:hypothetical protein
MANIDTYRVVARASDGSLSIRDYPTCEPLLKSHLQVGTDDCSTDLALRGLPLFRGLIGPMPEGKNIVRYETPEVFEMMTKEWGSAKPRRRRRRSSAVVAEERARFAAEAENAATAEVAAS